MSTAINTALSGLQANQRALAHSAQRISRWGTAATPETGDLSAEMVGLLRSRQGFAANLSVIRVANQMLGSLLDVLA